MIGSNYDIITVRGNYDDFIMLTLDVYDFCIMYYMKDATKHICAIVEKKTNKVILLSSYGIYVGFRQLYFNYSDKKEEEIVFMFAAQQNDGRALIINK